MKSVVKKTLTAIVVGFVILTFVFSLFRGF